MNVTSEIAKTINDPHFCGTLDIDSPLSLYVPVINISSALAYPLMLRLFKNEFVGINPAFDSVALPIIPATFIYPNTIL